MSMFVMVASALIILTVNSLAGGTWACGYKVIVQKNQKPVSLSKKSTAACADAIHDLLVSCSVDSTGSVEADQRWKEILASDFFIHLVGAESFELDIATKETIKVREILLPLADNKRPDYVFVRDGHNVRAYCKYNPRILQKIDSIPELGFTKNPFSASH
jgi:hypothetical protein